jgi:uncharacterized integral membrane protein
MSFLRRIYASTRLLLLLLWLAFLALLGAKLTQQNPQLVDVDLTFWRMPSVPLGIVLCATLLVGLILGISAMLPSVLLVKFKIHRLGSQTNKLSKEISP